MDSSLAIRSADLEDINTIGFLAQQIWPNAYQDLLPPEQLNYMLNLFYSPSSLRRQMLEDKHSFLIMEEEEDPIGFASWSAAEDPGLYKLHKLYVLPGMQGKGLGKAILDYIQDELRPLGATALHLNVKRDNKARWFYEKLGFVIIGEINIDIGENYFMRDYVMEKRLV